MIGHDFLAVFSSVLKKIIEHQHAGQCESLPKDLKKYKKDVNDGQCSNLLPKDQVTGRNYENYNIILMI